MNKETAKLLGQVGTQATESEKFEIYVNYTDSSSLKVYLARKYNVSDYQKIIRSYKKILKMKKGL